MSGLIELDQYGYGHKQQDVPVLIVFKLRKLVVLPQLCCLPGRNADLGLLLGYDIFVLAEDRGASSVLAIIRAISAGRGTVPAEQSRETVSRLFQQSQVCLRCLKAAARRHKRPRLVGSVRPARDAMEISKHSWTTRYCTHSDSKSLSSAKRSDSCCDKASSSTQSPRSNPLDSLLVAYGVKVDEDISKTCLDRG